MGTSVRPRRPLDDIFGADDTQPPRRSLDEIFSRPAPAITTTAQPGGPIERGIARAQLGMGKTTPGMYAFGEEREQLTPQQRGSLERARAGREIAEEVGRSGLGGQVPRTVSRVRAGAATLLGQENAPALREQVRKVEEETAPRTMTGAGVRLASEIAPYAVLGIGGSAALTGLESAAGPEQSTVNMLLRATGRREIQNPYLRAGADVALDMLPSGVVRALTRGAEQAPSRVRVPRRAVERAAPPAPEPTIRGLLPSVATETRPVMRTIPGAEGQGLPPMTYEAGREVTRQPLMPQAARANIMQGPAMPMGEVRVPETRIGRLLPAPRQDVTPVPSPTGPAIPMPGAAPITAPSRLLPAQGVERSPFIEARLEDIFIPRRLSEIKRAGPVVRVPETGATTADINAYRTTRKAPLEPVVQRERELSQMARLEEARALDVYPDGTPRVTPQEIDAAPYRRSPKAPRNLSDRELDLEFQRAQGRIEELESARGALEAAEQQAGGEILGATARGQTRSMYTPKQWKKMLAEKRKDYVESRRGQAEKLTIGERQQLGYDLTEDVRGMIEAAGYSNVEEFRAMERLARKAEFELPSLRKRFDDLQAEYSKRGFQSLPREVPPSVSAEAPDEVLRELDVLGEQAALRGDARLGAAIAPNVASMAAGGALGAAPAEGEEEEEEVGTRLGRGLLGAAAAAGGYQAYRALRGRVPQVGEALSQIGRRAEEVPTTALDETAPTVGGVPPTTAARMERAAERIQKPPRPYPSDATYVPRTDDEWRTFYERFASGQQEVDELEALRKAGKIQAQQGTRPIAKDTRLAKAIAESFGDLELRDAGRKLSGPELLALRGQREINAARRLALQERLADEALSDADRAWMRPLLAALEDKSINQYNRYTRDVSQTGRDMRLLREAKKVSDNPADWLLRAERLAGGRPLPEHLQLQLINAVTNERFGEASRVVNDARERGAWADQVGEFIKSGYLSNIFRPVRDVFSNVLNLADKQAERVAATFIDTIFGVGTGIRTADYSLDSFKALQRGLYEGGQAAAAIMRGSGSPETIARAAKRYDFENETLQSIPWFRAYTRYIRRTLGATDAVTAEAANAAAKAEMARVAARNKGFKPGTVQFKEAVREYLTNMPLELQAVVDAQTSEAVFQNQTVLGELASATARSRNNLVRLLGDVAIPFRQTPGSMITQTAKGVFGAPTAAAYDAPRFINALMKKADIPEKQRALVDRLAKASIGGAWMYAGYVLNENGKMTSWMPTNDRERRRWELQGRAETALNIGGTYILLRGLLGPQSVLMAIGAGIREMIDDDPEFLAKSFAEKAGAVAQKAGAGVLRETAEMPMLQGVGSVTDLLTQVGSEEEGALGEAGAKVAQTYLGGFVPQVIQQIARASDVTPEGRVRVRQVLAPGAPLETARRAVFQGFPGLRQSLPVRRTGLGEERTTSVGGLAGAFSPARLYRETTNPVAQELWRTGAAVPRTPQRSGEPAAAFDARQQALGTAVTQAVQEAMQDPEYQAIASMDVTGLREALGTLMQEEGQPLPELERLQSMSDDDIRRRYQGLILDRVIQRARTGAGAAFPNPRGGRAGTVLRSLTRP